LLLGVFDPLGGMRLSPWHPATIYISSTWAFFSNFDTTLANQVHEAILTERMTTTTTEVRKTKLPPYLLSLKTGLEDD
jgi:hypothetical protein